MGLVITCDKCGKKNNTVCGYKLYKYEIYIDSPNLRTDDNTADHYQCNNIILCSQCQNLLREVVTAEESKFVGFKHFGLIESDFLTGRKT